MMFFDACMRSDHPELQPITSLDLHKMLLLIVFFLQIASAANEEFDKILAGFGNVSKTTLDIGISLSWQIKDKTVTFALSSNSSGWLALGFSDTGGMVGADIAVNIS